MTSFWATFEQHSEDGVRALTGEIRFNVDVPEPPTESKVLYDVDFSVPEHFVNRIPSVGEGMSYVSGVTFGTPTVRDSFSYLLKNRLLEFATEVASESVFLRLNKGASSYRVDFDIATENLNKSKYAFSVMLGTPSVRSVSLHGGLDNIHVFPPLTPKDPPVSFSDGQNYHFSILADFDQDLWQVYLDNRLIASNSLDGSPDIQDMSFTLSPWTLTGPDGATTKVAIDNIRIITDSPAPRSPVPTPTPKPSATPTPRPSATSTPNPFPPVVTSRPRKPGDKKPPQLDIVGGTTQRTKLPFIILHGTAGDAKRVKSVEIQSGSGPFRRSSGSSKRWYQLLGLQFGSNVFTVRVTDRAGNVTKRRVVIIRG